QNMANAIKKISVARGYDITKYALSCIGGAGGPHACRVAETLGIRTIIIHPFSGRLSAYGIGLGDLRANRPKSVEHTFAAPGLRLSRQIAEELLADARADLIAQGVEEGRIEDVVRVHLRYRGTDTALDVNWSNADLMRESFEGQHLQRFGFIQ